MEPMPTGAVCFLWLVATSAMLQVLVYALTLAKATREMTRGERLSGESETLLEKVMNPMAMAGASTALTAAPLAGLLILYITFRCKTQLIADDDSPYLTVQFGMVLLTGGILARCADGFNIRLESSILGNLSASLGQSALYVGYAILLVGLMFVKSDAYTLSTAGACFAALAIFVLGCLVVVGLIPAMAWLNPSGDENENQKIVARVQDVQSAASFAPMVMLVFFYLHFLPWASSEELPSITNEVVVATTVGVFLQGLGVAMKVYEGEEGWAMRVGSALRLLATLFMYTGYAACLYCAWVIEQPSSAIHNFLLLVAPVAFVKLIVVLIQELSLKALLREEDRESVTAYLRLLQQMADSLSQTMLISLMLLFVHFRAEFYLETSGDGFIKYHRGLDRAMYLLTISLYVLMLVDLTKAMTGSDLTDNSFAVSVVNVFMALKFFFLAVLIIACCLDGPDHDAIVKL